MASKAATQLRKDYRLAFTGEAGTRVLRNMMANFGMSRCNYSPGMDGMQVAFREGQRSVILSILCELQEKVDPEKFLNDMHQSDIDFQRMTTEI